MSANLAEIRRGELSRSLSPFHIPGCHFTPTSLEIEDWVKYEDWEKLGRKLQIAEIGLQWWIGDWMNHGEKRFAEKYAQAIALTGLKVKTIQNYAYVAKAVDRSRRREADTVDFSTHAEVACLPADEQERILADAEKNPLNATVKKVRREVHKAQRRLGKKKSEIQILQTQEVQNWLLGLHKSLLEYEATVPASAPFLRNMIRSMIGVVLQQSERTVESDCDAILKMFTGDAGSEGVYSATDDDIFQWLLARFYFMRDPELDDRLELMSQHSRLEREAQDKKSPPHRLSCKCTDLNKRLRMESEGGKKETQRGDMRDVYMLYDSRTGDAFNRARADSVYSQGERE